jgi:hypothetical protein
MGLGTKKSPSSNDYEPSPRTKSTRIPRFVTEDPYPGVGAAKRLTHMPVLDFLGLGVCADYCTTSITEN